MKVSKKHLLKLLYENDGDEINLVDIVPNNITLLTTDLEGNVIGGFHKSNDSTVTVIESGKELTLDESIDDNIAKEPLKNTKLKEFFEDIGKSLNTESLRSKDTEAMDMHKLRVSKDDIVFGELRGDEVNLDLVLDGSKPQITFDNIAEDFLDEEDEVSDLSDNLMVDLGISNAFSDEDSTED